MANEILSAFIGLGGGVLGALIGAGVTLRIASKTLNEQRASEERSQRAQRELAYKKEVYLETVETVSAIVGHLTDLALERIDLMTFQLHTRALTAKLNRCIVMGSDEVMHAATMANHVMIDAMQAAAQGHDVRPFLLQYGDAVFGVFLAIRTELELGTREALEKWTAPMRLRIELLLPDAAQTSPPHDEAPTR